MEVGELEKEVEVDDVRKMEAHKLWTEFYPTTEEASKGISELIEAMKEIKE